MTFKILDFIFIVSNQVTTQLILWKCENIWCYIRTKLVIHKSWLQLRKLSFLISYRKRTFTFIPPFLNYNSISNQIKSTNILIYAIKTSLLEKFWNLRTWLPNFFSQGGVHDFLPNFLLKFFFISNQLIFQLILWKSEKILTLHTFKFNSS